MSEEASSPLLGGGGLEPWDPAAEGACLEKPWHRASYATDRSVPSSSAFSHLAGCWGPQLRPALPCPQALPSLLKSPPCARSWDVSASRPGMVSPRRPSPMLLELGQEGQWRDVAGLSAALQWWAQPSRPGRSWGKAAAAHSAGAGRSLGWTRTVPRSRGCSALVLKPSREAPSPSLVTPLLPLQGNT